MKVPAFSGNLKMLNIISCSIFIVSLSHFWQEFCETYQCDIHHYGHSVTIMEYGYEDPSLPLVDTQKSPSYTSLALVFSECPYVLEILWDRSVRHSSV